MANRYCAETPGTGRVRTIVIGTLFLVVVLFGSVLAAGAVAGPRIVAKELTYDFGKVVQGTDVTHVFEVANGGSEPLDIQRVQSS
jgi:hypothetical protein